MPENTCEFAEICVEGTIRRGARRLGLQSRTRLGHRLYRLRIFIFQFPIPLPICSSTPCISATSAPCRKTHPNLRCRHYTARWEKAGFACPYRFWHLLHQLRVFVLQLPILFASCSCAPSISATSVPFRKIHPNLLKFALRGGSRLVLLARTGLGTFCTNCRFSFFNCPSSLLHAHVHLALVQHLHHAGNPPRICGNLR